MSRVAEWNIRTTSDKCPYIQETVGFDDIAVGVECDYPGSISGYCCYELCPVKLEERMGKLKAEIAHQEEVIKQLKELIEFTEMSIRNVIPEKKVC